MLAYTLFEILNAPDLEFSYRILRVRENLPDDNLRPVRAQRWADLLWRDRLRVPVFPRVMQGRQSFIVPSDARLDGADLSIRDLTGVTYHLDPLEGTVMIDLRTAGAEDLEFVGRQVERRFSEVLRAHKDYWRDTWTRFFRLQPENVNEQRDHLHAYRGFQFAVVPSMGRLFLAIDVVTRYVSRLSLADYRGHGRATELTAHCNVPLAERLAFLRDNAQTKYRCFYAGDTGKTVSELVVDSLGETILSYYQRRYQTITVDPDDAAVFYTEKKDGGTPTPCPAGRLFPVFPTEHIGFRACSVSPQMSPVARITAISSFVRDLSGARYRGTILDVDQSPLVADSSAFQMPRLEFGDGHILAPTGLVPGDDPVRLAERWGPAKMQALYRAGPHHVEPFPTTVIVYPNQIGRALRDDFVDAVRKEMKLQSGLDLAFARLVPYAVDPDGQDLLAQIGALKISGHGALVICVLASGTNEGVYFAVKHATRSAYSQCLRQETIGKALRSRSTLRNLVLGILVSSGAKPWVLADPLHHDLTVGIDVQSDRACYSYLYGDGGRLMLRRVGETGAKEAIGKRRLREELVSTIGEISGNGTRPRTIVVHRDGRAWPTELEGIEQAIERLRGSGAIAPDARVAVVELHKTHIPIRIFTAGGVHEAASYRNPYPGCYFVLDSARAILSTTGRPERWDSQGRTARTLLLRLVSGGPDFSIAEIAEDIFHLTQLNWNAPDIDVSLPVSIRWNDELLREMRDQDDD